MDEILSLRDDVARSNVERYIARDASVELRNASFRILSFPLLAPAILTLPSLRINRTPFAGSINFEIRDGAVT